MPLIDAQLQELLVCPDCRGELEADEAASKLRCLGCGLAYPVRDGLPTMLVSEADKPEGFVGSGAN
ncbi:MAG TPA: Trm112 family protein [Abditibacteriaceae bacterium]|jgi:hypothetical protein